MLKTDACPLPAEEKVGTWGKLGIVGVGVGSMMDIFE